MRHEIIPTLRYQDAPRAIDFLCTAFGFERRVVYLDERDPTIVQHAQLNWGDRMVMVSTVKDDEAARAARIRTAADTGGPTMGLYLIVDDVDAHAARSTAAGATIAMPPRDQGYGGRGYSAHDCEGNIWSFGTYDPWA